jgi:ubiquinone/menaquinone biosynthesis C-methylase UbiE
MTTPQHAEFHKEHYPNGVNAHFYGVVDQFTGPEGKFETHARGIAKYADAITDLLPFEAYAHVLDLGAGTGLFAKRMANKLNDFGKLWLAELSPSFIEYLKEKVLKKSDEEKGQVSWQDRCQVVASTEHGVPDLPDHSVDFVFICDVYHHIEYPLDVLGDLKRILKPTGHLLLIDFYRDSNICKAFAPGFIEEHVRANKDVFQKEVEDAGFKFEEELFVDGLVDNYFLLFSVASTT